MIKALKFHLLTLCLFLSGCTFLMVLSGPRAMTTADEGYYTHSRQGVTLFKIKAPKGTWLTRDSSWSKRNGEDEPLYFIESQSELGDFPKTEFRVEFLADNIKDRIDRAMIFMKGGDPGPLSSYIENYVEEKYKLLGVAKLGGASCMKFSFHDNKGIGVTERFNVGLMCPGFFKHTFGMIISYVAVGGSKIKSSVLLEDRYKMIEPVVQESLHSLQFIEPFSQVAPPGFSIEEQLRRISAGGQPYGPPKFKL